MKNVFRLFISLPLFMASLLATDIVATVNGSAITKAEANDFVVKEVRRANYDALSLKDKKIVVNKLIDRRLYLEDAKKGNIQSRPDFIQELQRMKENLMLNYWLKDKAEEIVVDDREAKIYYRDHHQKFNEPASVKVRHILLATEEEARSIIRELQHTKRENLARRFIQLAKERSIGPSKKYGGELDWFIREQMVPEFSEESFSLRVGEISLIPIKTQFGYHVIYLEDKKEGGNIPFEMVKAEIIKKIRLEKVQTKLEKLSKKLRKSANISNFTVK
jgi:parvulin-like peptidyl-prolyl isomerase